MWRTSPAKPVHASGVRRRGGSDSSFSSPLFSSPTSLSSRPPRLAPLSTAPALPTSSTPSSSIGNIGTTAAAGEAMAHAPAPSRTRPPGAFLGSSHDVPSSTALWPHAQARHPHPPHLAALSAHRPWPEEMSWRRSKPLTRRVTTTLTATSSTLEGKRRASRRSSEGRGDALDSPAPPLLPPPLPPHSPRTRAHEPAKGKEEEEEANAVREDGGATHLVRSSAGMPNQDGDTAIPSKELHTADVSSHDTLPAVAHFPSPLRAENEDSSVAALVAMQTELCTPLISSTETSYTGCSEAKITCATAGAPAAASEVAAPRSSVQWLVSEADAPPSDYALAHQLPQLFAEMIDDLAAAQPQPSAIADSSGSDAVERWIQQWFRARYHRTQSPSASPSSPAVKRARRNGARDPLTASRRDHAMVSFPRSGDRRRRGRRRSSASSTSSSAATGAASTSSSSISLSTCSLNQKFIPLAGAEAAATPVAEEVSSSLCASLTSTTASHHDDGGGAHLLLRPTHCFMSTSQRTSATSMAVGAPVPLTSPQPPRAPPSQSPPPNANAVAGAARPPPPPPPPTQRSSTSAAVKRSTSGSIRGAAVVGGGRGPATSACAVVGLLSSMSAPEAAHSQK